MEEVMEDLSTAGFLWVLTRFRRNLVGNLSTGLFLEITLKEIVFVAHKYYYIFLLQQEASAP
jgi:hypothetical protein